MKNIINVLIHYGILGIAVAGFSEGIFLPMPMEFIFIPIVLTNTSNALLYSIVLIVFSTLGSIVGYYAGKFIGKSLLGRIVSKDIFSKLENMYNKNAFLTTLTSSFTPIPYEAYVLSAGLFNMNIIRFIFASIISRVIRYLPQGLLITLLGDAVISYIKNYTILAGVLVLIVFLAIKYYLKNKHID